MNNLHISLTDFKNQSRVLKETRTLLKSNIVSKVYVASLAGEGLLETQKYEPNLEVKRFVLKTRDLSKKPIIQFIKFLEFMIRIILFYKNKNIKIVNIHSVALLPLGVLLKYLYKSKLVYDTHELETEKKGLYGVRKKLSKFIEKRMICFVDITFVVSENIADWYENEYKINRPTVLFNAPKLKKRVKTNHFREKLGISQNSVIFIYQGNLGKGRGIEVILEAFESREDNRAVIVFMGYGILEEDIINKSKINDNIFFYPAVDPDIVLEYTSSADVGISIIENICLSYYYCMPNKLFEYGMAGLPVMVSGMKEMKESVEKYNIGFVLQKVNYKIINRKIDDVLTLDLQFFKTNARKFAEEYSWENQEIKMLKEYKNIVTT